MTQVNKEAVSQFDERVIEFKHWQRKQFTAQNIPQENNAVRIVNRFDNESMEEFKEFLDNLS